MADTVKSIAVVLPQATVSVGASITVSADVTTNVPDAALDPQAITWSSSNPAVATVTASATGAVVKGVAAGSTVIKAAIGTVSGQATLTVQALPFVAISAADMDKLLSWAIGTKFELKDPNGRVALSQVNG